MPKTDKSTAHPGVPPQATGSEPYAIVTHETLKIKKFSHEDEWKTAMTAVHSRGKEFTAFKYHHGAETYVALERWE
jgi:hypothetical protein